MNELTHCALYAKGPARLACGDNVVGVVFVALFTAFVVLYVYRKRRQLNWEKDV